MKIIRYKDPHSNEIKFGVISGNKVCKLEGSPYDENLTINKKKSFELKFDNLLSPCNPNKIIALAINYLKLNEKKQSFHEPIIFLKTRNTISKCNQKIKLFFDLPTWGESELGLVIKRLTKNVTIKEANNHILGYLPVNDVTCNNIENRDHHLARSKSADGYCPIGYYIDTEYNYNNKIIESYHNNILLRRGNTNDMLWKPEKIISWLSKWMTLNAGDLIITGAPPRVKNRMYIKNGDIFTVKIEGFPKLENTFYGSSK